MLFNDFGYRKDRVEMENIYHKSDKKIQNDNFKFASFDFTCHISNKRFYKKFLFLKCEVKRFA